jgi:hypothetical protein
VCVRENMRAGHDGNQRGACLKRVGGHRCGGEWATVGLHHGGVAPPLQQSAERVHLTRSGVTQSMDTPPSSFRFCPGWPAHCAWQQGGEFSGEESLEKRRGEGGGACSRTRSPGLFSHVSPPAPLPRSLRRLLAPSLPPTSFPFPSQSLAYFPIFQPSHASRCRRVYKRGDWGRARQRVGGVTHGKERKVRTSER